ncbi:MFS transporter [Alysiella crassa]|uniref:Sucrose/H+ symporter n=2 Tax=Alysiella crassa TaxID=153491 RepID=A0A376BMA6_9NEIS|nr:MFS transporter [Alysiella crassa]SSY70354.1 sucrose/H+ symporter [Alysiella crassa]
MTQQQLMMTFRQIILMNFGFFGIQYSFGLQQTAVNPIYSFLGAPNGDLPLLNMAGPVTGLIVQPIIGALSDRTWISPWGRRRPFFLIGAIGCSIALFLFPHVTALWMAVLMLWILDISNNTAMEPYRAFVADTLPEKQQGIGFLMQSMFTGLGITLANVSLYFFQQMDFLKQVNDSGIPYWVYGSFYLGAICSIGSVLISVFSTTEKKPSDEEIARIKAQPKGLGVALADIFSAIKDMPKALKQLALVYLFQWYALFIYWQFATPSIAKSVWNTTPDDKTLYGEAVAWTGLVNGWYNIVTFISAFGLMILAKKYPAKVVHAGAVSLAAIALLIFPHISNKYLLFVPMIGFGVAWASIMGVPFLIATAEIPRERYGVYMGIINMMIVIPMLIQTLTFGKIYDYVLGSNPSNAMMSAGVLLALAAVFTLRIQTKQGQNLQHEA